MRPLIPPDPAAVPDGHPAPLPLAPIVPLLRPHHPGDGQPGSTSRSVTRADARALALLVGAWLVACLLVDPRADVALLDDWCYAISVEQLLAGQGFHVSPWSSTFPALQIWWGTLFAWLGGFSFTMLRLSTLVMWLVGTLASYGCLRALGCRPGVALVGALALFVHPVVFVLAFTFMTDVPFIAMALLSLWALVIGLRTARLATIVLGLGVAVLAFFVRPVAIALPAGLLLGAGMANGRALRHRAAILAVVTIVLMVIASTVAAHFFPFAGAGGVAYRVQRLRFILMVPPVVYLEAALSMLAHVGLAVVPVLLAFGPMPGRGGWWTAIGLIVAALVVSFLAPSAVSVLKVAHTVSIEELGAARPLLQGAAPRGSGAAVLATIATAIGLAAAGCLLARMAAGLRPGGFLRTPPWAGVGGFGLASAALCFVLWFFYDRYYLPVVVVAIALAVAEPALTVRPWRRGLAGALLVGLAVLDVTGTRDMLAFARAVNAASARLRAAGISELRVDAGYVENGWRLYAHPERLPPGKVPALDVPHVTANADHLPYVIADDVLPGYRVRETVAVPTWWAATNHIYVLEAE